MRRKSEIPQLICNKLLDLMEDTPFEKIKVTELVESANISRSVFYIYFDSIYDVVQKIEDEFIDNKFRTMDFLKPLTNPFKQKSPEQQAVVNHLKKYTRTYRILSGPNGDPSFQVRLDKVFRAESSQLVSNLKSVDDILKSVFIAYRTAGCRAVLDWMSLHPEMSDKEILSIALLSWDFSNNLFETLRTAEKSE